MASHAAWQAILSDDLRGCAMDAVREVAAWLASLPDTQLASGAHEAALVHAYLDRAEPASVHRNHTQRMLELSASFVATTPLSPALFGGFTGVAWVHRHLAADDLGDDEVDEVLAELVERQPWQRPYDLISGLVGIGLYSLERLPRPLAARGLDAVLDRLTELAEHTHAGITWRTALEHLPPQQRAHKPQGGYDLGLAHGVPGVLALLSRLAHDQHYRNRAVALLDGGAHWIVSQRLTEASASFGAWVGDVEPTRSAWCYGDPGAATALLMAARATGRDDWAGAALGLLRSAALRPPEDCGVDDASVCHGAAGLAHLFNRAYQATGDEQLASASREWIARTLALRKPQDSDACPFPYWSVSERGSHWKRHIGLLRGAGGVALVLLAAATAIVPEWDRMLGLGSY